MGIVQQVISFLVYLLWNRDISSTVKEGTAGMCCFRAGIGLYRGIYFKPVLSVTKGFGVGEVVFVMALRLNGYTPVSLKLTVMLSTVIARDQAFPNSWENW